MYILTTIMEESLNGNVHRKSDGGNLCWQNASAQRTFELGLIIVMDSGGKARFL